MSSFYNVDIHSCMHPTSLQGGNAFQVTERKMINNLSTDSFDLLTRR